VWRIPSFLRVSVFDIIQQMRAIPHLIPSLFSAAR
jgi:hypothetical protein